VTIDSNDYTPVMDRTRLVDEVNLTVEGYP
jgi:hypothetical protein